MERKIRPHQTQLICACFTQLLHSQHKLRALTDHEFRTSLEIKDIVVNFRLILMDMFQETIGHRRDPFFAEIFEMMKSQLLDDGPDSIHHVNID